MPDPTPDEVEDESSWDLIKELDDEGQGLTPWETEFTDSLMKQLLDGRFLSGAQKAKLHGIRDDRLP